MQKTSEIRSLKNPLVQTLKKLKRNPPADDGKVVIEGVRLIEEALRAGLHFETLFHTSQFQSFGGKAGNAYLVSDEVMKSVSLETTPPGLWGLIEIPKRPLTFDKDFAVLCGVRDPGNAGTIVRTAEAVDCSVFFSDDSVHPFHPKAVKGSMGSSFRVPVFRGELSNFLKTIKEKDFEILGAAAGSMPYHQWEYRKKFALLLGNEAQGLPSELSFFIDQTLGIPLGGKVESLNVAVSAAVILFHSRLKRTRLH